MPLIQAAASRAAELSVWLDDIAATGPDHADWDKAVHAATTIMEVNDGQ